MAQETQAREGQKGWDGLMRVSQGALEALEYGFVRKLLSAECAWSMTKEVAQQLRPACRPRTLRRWQEECKEARELLGRESPPRGGLSDLRNLLSRAQRGRVLEPEELLTVARAAETARRLGTFLKRRRERYPTLGSWAELLEDLSLLESSITEAVDDEGRVRDSASPQLLAIRRELRRLSDRIQDRMEGFLRSAAERAYLQDAVITQRSGRYVVPVKREFRGKVKGLVHDQSGSGATLFIEPQEVVDLNNSRRQKVLEERAEVERILRLLTQQAVDSGRELASNQGYLTRLDLSLARGGLSLKMKASSPGLGASGIVLAEARHPVLGDKAIPLTLRLDLEKRILVITGPNTGGKTVSVKTVGLLVLMAQTGLDVPARQMETPMFSKLFVDVGDEQSLEQNLSTFSSHLKNIIPVTREADDRTLVLMDEIGAGTDPQEGTALAMAILEEIHLRGSFAIATTHYSQLKAFAYLHPGMENASMEFDPATLSPTYRLIMGLPGRSNAFDIARGLGLPQEVLDRAAGMLSSDSTRAEDLIQNMQESLRRWEQSNLEAKREKEKAQKLRQYWEEREAEQREARRSLLDQARTEALDVVSRAKEEARDLINRLRDMESRSGSGALEARDWEAIRTRLTDMEQEARDRVDRVGERRQVRGEAKESWQPGERAYVVSLDQEGQVLSSADEEGSVLVQVGALRVRVKPQDLIQPSDGRGSGVVGKTVTPGSIASGSGALFQAKARGVSAEISIRGLTVDEALEKLDKYLDDAVLAGLSRVVIVHGKGTGALRQAVAVHLRAHRQVERFHLGEPGEGGSGVTVAYLSP